MTTVKVIADSIHGGHRITTLEATYPRVVHAQLLTHRCFSRNSQSSRAVPCNKAAALPVYVPIVAGNKRGMVAGEKLSPELQAEFDRDARHLREQAARFVADWSSFIHKQWLNRYLEPWSFITTVITATDWDGFFHLRCADDAQPEMMELACAMRDSLAASRPVPRRKHRPYHDAIVSSVAACARVSYLNHDGTHDVFRDAELFGRLRDSGHASPFEHVANACEGRHANFTGWRSLRNRLRL